MYTYYLQRLCIIKVAHLASGSSSLHKYKPHVITSSCRIRWWVGRSIDGGYILHSAMDASCKIMIFNKHENLTFTSYNIYSEIPYEVDIKNFMNSFSLMIIQTFLTRCLPAFYIVIKKYLNKISIRKKKRLEASSGQPANQIHSPFTTSSIYLHSDN